MFVVALITQRTHNVGISQKLKALLEILGKIIYAHTDPDVLETCAKTLEYLCTEGTAIFTTCDIERSNIIDECVKRYMEAIDEWRNLIEGSSNFLFPKLLNYKKKRFQYFR